MEGNNEAARIFLNGNNSDYMLNNDNENVLKNNQYMYDDIEKIIKDAALEILGKEKRKLNGKISFEDDILLKKLSKKQQKLSNQLYHIKHTKVEKRKRLHEKRNLVFKEIRKRLRELREKHTENILKQIEECKGNRKMYE